MQYETDILFVKPCCDTDIWRQHEMCTYIMFFNTLLKVMTIIFLMFHTIKPTRPFEFRWLLLDIIFVNFTSNYKLICFYIGLSGIYVHWQKLDISCGNSLLLNLLIKCYLFFFESNSGSSTNKSRLWKITRYPPYCVTIIHTCSIEFWYL